MLVAGLVMLATLTVGLAGVTLGQASDESPTPGRVPEGSVPDGGPPGDAPADPGVVDATNLDKHPKMDGVIAATARTAHFESDAAALDLARSRGVTVVGTTVRVIVESVDPDPSAAHAVVVAAGGIVEAEYADAIQALLAPSALEQVANDPTVRYIQAPARGVPNHPAP
jgi:hypothetical protein